ncbi:hypothetical protein FPOA_03784 [Fusarium poae]|uniref:Uncharacterized protein n=1 Tax=Fusarium poae TaxID=36050 RepID=A0A1B8ASA0_FUSPO|nr:hypothetical protein FPOA_03784 [Fusarium poae]
MPAMIQDDNGVFREMSILEMAAAGVARLNQIRVAIADARRPGGQSTPNQLPPVIQPPEYPYTTHVEIRDDFPHMSNDTVDAFAALELPSDGYHLVYINPINSDAKPYWNFIHDRGSVIVCAWNFRSMDPTPKPKKWSDLLAASCVAAVTQTGAPASMAECVAIWRLNIVNQQTQRIINLMKEENGNPFRAFEVGEEDPLFLALLSSDNGRSIACMLRDYPWLFDFKTIVSAYIVPSDLPCVYWMLKKVFVDIVPPRPRPEDIPLPDSPPETLSKKELRQHKKSISRG